MNTLRLLATHVLTTLAVAAAPAMAMEAAIGTEPNATITAPALANAGDTLTIGFSDPTRANQTVRLVVDNGAPGGDREEQTFEVTLDESGNGSTQWVAPAGWEGALFNDPDGDAHEVATLFL